jgi:two-component system NtrC family sensor kinase
LLFEPQAEIPSLMFDADLLHRAVLNVVTNAIDASEKCEQGRVIVRTKYSVPEQRVRVIVEDNGEGIAPADIKRIFSVFESRKGARGTGLGLPVSQKVLREHGGDVIIESTLGVGSRFILEIPAIFPSEAPLSRETLYGVELPE